MHTSLRLSGGASVYFEHTASRAGENEDRGEMEKTGERREINRISLLSESRKHREEPVREDAGQGERNIRAEDAL